MNGEFWPTPASQPIIFRMDGDSELEIFGKILADACSAGKITLKHCRVARRTKDEKLLMLVSLNELIRKCESVLAMLRDDAWAGIGTVSRSCFETFADIRNLAARGRPYSDYMLWMSLEQERSGLQGILNHPESNYSVSMEERTKSKYGKTLSQIIEDTKSTMNSIADSLPEEYKDKNGGVLKSDFQRFELADLVTEYNVLYRRLSGGAHGRVSDMVDGIVEEDGIVWPPDELPDPPLAAVDCLCAILLEATGRVCKSLGKTNAHVKPIVRAHAGAKRGLGGKQLRDGLTN